MSGDHEHLAWGADALWQRLNPLLPGLSVEVVARLPSTNTELVERSRSAAGRRSEDSLPCLLVAEHQTLGRGRMGRNWRSAPGASLTFSLALPLAPANWSGLSLAVGVVLADALDAEASAAPRIGLKWPNDLWLWEAPGRGRKLGGILIETVTVGAQRMAVIGIGLNVRAPQADGFSQGAAGLDELTPEVTAPQVLAQVAVPLVQAVQRFEADGLTPFLESYRRRDVLAGQALLTQGIEPALDGTADGIDVDGALRVATPVGLQRVVGGEVSVRLQAC